MDSILQECKWVFKRCNKICSHRGVTILFVTSSKKLKFNVHRCVMKFLKTNTLSIILLHYVYCFKEMVMEKLNVQCRTNINHQHNVSNRKSQYYLETCTRWSIVGFIFCILLINAMSETQCPIAPTYLYQIT